MLHATASIHLRDTIYPRGLATKLWSEYLNAFAIFCQYFWPTNMIWGRRWGKTTVPFLLPGYVKAKHFWLKEITTSIAQYYKDDYRRKFTDAITTQHNILNEKRPPVVYKSDWQVKSGKFTDSFLFHWPRKNLFLIMKLFKNSFVSDIVVPKTLWNLTLPFCAIKFCSKHNLVSKSANTKD